MSAQQSNHLNTRTQYFEQVVKRTIEKNCYSVYCKFGSS